MHKITALIITLNEEKNIARCIDSLQGVVDEILVIDSFSTDRTKEICIAQGARFIENKWNGYADQKNFGQLQASHDYILSLDADESLSKELATSIISIKNSSSFELYAFKRLTNYCGNWIRHGGWYPDKKIRFYDRRDSKWEGNVHEKLIYPSSKKVVLLDGDCLHYTYYTVSEHLKQVDLFTTLKAKAAIEKGKSVNVFHFLFKPSFKFFSGYILKLGFLDGYSGYVISKISAYATFIKYVKIKELKRKRK